MIEGGKQELRLKMGMEEEELEQETERAADDIGGKAGGNNGTEVREVEAGANSVQSCRGVKPAKDLLGHWVWHRRPLTSSLSAVSWADESRLNYGYGCGHGHQRF